MTRKLKFLFTIIAVALLSSCSQSLEKKAQKLIENDMKTNYFEGGAEGAKVYEYKSLSFGTLDSVFTEVASDLVYMENVQKEEKFLDLAKKMQDKIKHKESMPHVYKRYKDIDGEYDEDLKNWIMWLDSAKYYMNKTEIIANNFKPILVGWKMAHTFSGVGVFGKRVATADFYFTKDVSEIYSSKSTLIEKFNSEKEEDVHVADLKVDFLSISGDLGQITFSQEGQTIFYYDEQNKKGKIKINGNEYVIDKCSYDKQANSFFLSGNQITINCPNLEYYEDEGGDCMYGKFSVVTITLGSNVLTISNVEVQDCPLFD
ncbi:MAG TPA: hypothetical protein GX723_13065 [Thermoanaerobacterales bacterium]|nr:hypothetical protein [Thermoanaerobacterales bacterium]